MNVSLPQRFCPSSGRRGVQMSSTGHRGHLLSDLREASKLQAQAVLVRLEALILCLLGLFRCTDCATGSTFQSCSHNAICDTKSGHNVATQDPIQAFRLPQLAEACRTPTVCFAGSTGMRELRSHCM